MTAQAKLANVKRAARIYALALCQDDHEGERLDLQRAARIYALSLREVIPPCDHSVCQQHWADSGKGGCIDDP